MSWWPQMVGDLVMSEDLQAAFALAMAVPLSIGMAALGQLLKRLPSVYMRSEAIPDFMTALGMVLGFVMSYAFGMPKPLMMMVGTLAGTMSGRAFDYTRSAMERVGPVGSPTPSP